ncbi:MAG: PdxA family dehydrogenase, partial [Chloroflexota bacterium]
MNHHKPLLAITMGDPAGAGPEITVKALADAEIQGLCRGLVIGDAGTMRAAVDIVGADMRVQVVQSPEQMEDSANVLNVIDLKNVDVPSLVRGRVHPEAGRAAYESIEKATLMTLAGEAEAVVTAPLNKDALNQAGYHFPGHTQILAHLSGVSDAVMMLAADNLRIAHVSTHVSLREACDLVTRERILRVMELGVEAVRNMGIEEPRVVVPGLNPHSGEGGLFGDEEVKHIIPAIEEAKDKGFD